MRHRPRAGHTRGRALVATGDLEAAEEELARLREAAEGPELEGMVLEFNGSQHVLRIGLHVLAGRLAEARGDLDRAVGELREAVRLEDALLYGEPPEWTVPVRQELGAVLLAAGRDEEAERVYREDLDRFRENGWSLLGLAQALEGQGSGGRRGRGPLPYGLARSGHRDRRLEPVARPGFGSHGPVRAASEPSGRAFPHRERRSSYAGPAELDRPCRRSRISVSSFTSAEGSGWAASGSTSARRLSRLNPFTTRKTAQATRRKLMRAFTKAPQFRVTAPAWFAASRVA